MTIANRIFLAHASEDKPLVQELYTRLKAKGFLPWLDTEDLIPGQNWREEIPKAIRMASICLACLSKRSVAKRGYVQREFRLAMSAYADLPDGSIYLIPVRLDDCEVPDLEIADLKVSLRDFHWVDLFNDTGFEKLVRAIEPNVKSEDEILADRLNLAPEEAKFAAALASGLSIKEYAEQAERSIHYVRWLLKQVQARTNTRRTAELIVLLNRYLYGLEAKAPRSDKSQI